MITPIYPEPGPTVSDLAEFLFADRRVGVGRPWLMVNMVNSIDGATAVDGGTTGLNDADDQALFHAFRSVSDVILAGASTIREEDYGPVALKDPGREARHEAGRHRQPRLAFVSRSLELDPSARVFSDADNPPLLFTVANADPTRVAQLADRAEVVVAGEENVDFARLLAWLGERGHEVVLCEGGPSTNGELIADDLVDEINLSTSPMVVAGPSPRIVHSLAPVPSPLPFYLDRLMTGERTLFARWLREAR
ncbi:MAG: dihydrofolate reductase family protein [Acidimicrobiia bacterium]